MDELFAISTERPDEATYNELVSRLVHAGYVPLNCVPRSIRGNTPYLSLHFVACSDVPNHQ